VHPDVKAVVLAATDESADIAAAFEAGAAVYCVKSAYPDDLVSAVRQAFRKSVFFADESGARTRDVTSQQRDSVPELTRRETEILKLVAEGYSNAQLARLLWVTEQTVKFHLSNIYRKLDVANRTEASRWAQLNGLLGSERPVMTAA
jgi:DNA-binding NarL/FixJ family response regulator